MWSTSNTCINYIVIFIYIYFLLNVHFSYNDRERDSSAFTRVESSGFLTPSNDTITMKLIDKSLNWEARGSEVLTPSLLTKIN